MSFKLLVNNHCGYYIIFFQFITRYQIWSASDIAQWVGYLTIEIIIGSLFGGKGHESAAETGQRRTNLAEEAVAVDEIDRSEVEARPAEARETLDAAEADADIKAAEADIEIAQAMMAALSTS